jgi:hypothetical protein
MQKQSGDMLQEHLITNCSPFWGSSRGCLRSAPFYGWLCYWGSLSMFPPVDGLCLMVGLAREHGQSRYATYDPATPSADLACERSQPEGTAEPAAHCFENEGIPDMHCRVHGPSSFKPPCCPQQQKRHAIVLCDQRGEDGQDGCRSWKLRCAARICVVVYCRQ